MLGLEGGEYNFTEIEVYVGNVIACSRHVSEYYLLPIASFGSLHVFG